MLAGGPRCIQSNAVRPPRLVWWRILRLVGHERTESSFSEALPTLLDERGLSLRALARQAGVSHAHLSRLLRGIGYRSRPSADLARRVAVALSLPPDYFKEYREAVVLDEVRRNVALREEIYDRVRHASDPP
jgi:transcriptional regulator with XRE-family HTH domain